ncbi:hypothetical protein ACWPKO_22590 (plasmid) [Coraliomargarita sp. W4R53]
MTAWAVDPVAAAIEHPVVASTQRGVVVEMNTPSHCAAVSVLSVVSGVVDQRPT